MKRSKICVVTGSRAEYGLLNPLLRELRRSAELKFDLVVTGMHLLKDFGLTIKQIKKDGFIISRTVDFILPGDDGISMTKSIGTGCIRFADVFKELKPDFVVVLGDRFEIFSAVVAGFIQRIPVAHLHGGELTEGAFDDAFRHAITKMSYLHFTSTDLYRKRVIQLGESPGRVFNVGALAVDNLRNYRLLDKRSIERELGIKLDLPTVLVTFHPVTLEGPDSSKRYFNELLEVLGEFPGIKIIFTFPNADAEGRELIRMTKEFVREHPDRAKAFASLGTLNYYSLLKFVAAVVGNSSSGVIEVPFFNKPTINLGDRQKGRLMAESVISCKPGSASIRKALKKTLRLKVRNRIKDLKKIYGNGQAGKKIVEKLAEFSRKKIILKKSFYDIPLPDQYV